MTLQPLVALDPHGVAPSLSYNVPDTTAYSGRHFIELDVPASYFPPPPDLGLYTLPPLDDALRGRLDRAMQDGFRTTKEDRVALGVVDPDALDPLFPDLGVDAYFLLYAAPERPVGINVNELPPELRPVPSDPPVHTISYTGVYARDLGWEATFVKLSPELRALTPDQVLNEMRQGKILKIEKSLSGIIRRVLSRYPLPRSRASSWWKNAACRLFPATTEPAKPLKRSPCFPEKKPK